MSAAENKLLLQEIFAGVARGETRMFVEHMAEDIVVTITGKHSWSRTFSGKTNALNNLYRQVNSLMAARGKTIPVRLLADEDWVVVEARGEMLTKKGERYDNEYCLLYRVRDRMIVEVREYMDSALSERVLGHYPATGASA